MATAVPDILVDQLKHRILSLSEVKDWPEMAALLGSTLRRRAAGSWEYLVAACQAVGGSEENALPGAAAICCTHLSIRLVDDLLDDDPGGEHHRLGVPQTANLALALQALSFRLLEDSNVGIHERLAIFGNLANTVLATSFGQKLDTASIQGEADYWRAVELKSLPFPSSTLFIGALLGGASLKTANLVEQFGAFLGKMVQINDDLADALTTPAAPDWKSKYNNLAILFALSVNHDQSLALQEALRDIDAPGALQHAQEILVQCGAVSFCAFKLLESERSAMQLLQKLAMPRPEFLEQLLENQIGPMRQIFARMNLPFPNHV